MPLNKSLHDYNESLIERGRVLMDVGFLKSWNKEIKRMNQGKVGSPFEYSNSYIHFLAFIKIGFKIAGGASGMKVSWQVTGIRKDPWANANRIRVEEDKPAKERGYYLHPDLYGQPEEKGISHLLFPKEKQELLVNKNKSNL